MSANYKRPRRCPLCRNILEGRGYYVKQGTQYNVKGKQHYYWCGSCRKVMLPEETLDE